jgi:hypothetical protein
VSLGQVLAVGQIAMSLLLLAVAALFVRTLSNLNSITVGFNRDNLLLVSLNARQAGYKDDALKRFYHDLQSRLAGLPGVRRASVSNYAMLSQSRNTTTFRIPGRPDPGVSLTVLSVGPGYLGTMQIPLLLGRDLDDRDFRSSGGAAVVNELFAKKWFAAENPVGRHFLIKGAKDETDFEIVGVAKTTPFQSLKEDAPPAAYVIYNRNPGQVVGRMVFTLRTASDPLALATAVHQAVREADSRIPVSSFNTEAQSDRTDHLAGTHLRHAMHVFRPARRGDRRRGAVRHDGVQRGAADQRDWDPDGAGRATGHTSRDGAG